MGKSKEKKEKFVVPDRKVAAKFDMDDLHRVSVYHLTGSKVRTSINFKAGTAEDGTPVTIDVELTPKLTQVLACELMGAVAQHIRKGSLDDDQHLSIGTREAVAELEKQHGPFRLGYNNNR